MQTIMCSQTPAESKRIKDWQAERSEERSGRPGVPPTSPSPRSWIENDSRRQPDPQFSDRSQRHYDPNRTRVRRLYPRVKIWKRCSKTGETRKGQFQGQPCQFRDAQQVTKPANRTQWGRLLRPRENASAWCPSTVIAVVFSKIPRTLPGQLVGHIIINNTYVNFGNKNNQQLRVPRLWTTSS